MNGTLQQLDDSAAGKPRALGWTLPAWKPDHRAGKKPEGDWHDLPSGIVAALKIAEPFVGRDASSPHTMGVLLNGQHIYATNNHALVQIDVGATVPTATIPLWLVRLLKKRDLAAAKMLVSARSIAFAWADGTWISAAACAELPAKVVKAFDGWRECSWSIPKDWKKEFKAVARFSAETIIIGPDKIKGGFGEAAFEAAIATPVQEGTVWTRTVLAPVVNLADRIDFSTWPKPACFAFANGRGFVAGRN